MTAMRPYSEKLTELLQKLSATLGSDTGSVYSEQREVNNVLVVAISSNRGLAGAFNSNIVKQAKELAGVTYADKKVDFFTIGKKGNDILSKTGNVAENNNAIFDHLSFEATAEIAERLMELYANGSYDRIVVVYNNFKNAATQFVLTEQFLPILPPKESETTSAADYIFEPNKVEIVEGLIPKSLKTQLFKAVLDSHAAEHGARMTAMDSASRNAGEMIGDLTLTYNKARQAYITKELIEIVNGSEVLKA